MDIRGGFFYTKEHEWVKIEGNKGTVGITEYASTTLGDITFIEVAPAGTIVAQFGNLGTIESVKAASDLFSPVSGKVVSVNEKVLASPETINSSPYDDGWLVVIEMTNPDDVKNLMTEEQYKEYINNL
ncbi:MAG: glycine cleavage system protein GcvH [Candidatus Omnitrophica bacterium]|nr:glycine cleavage system protein GcvH [Candidatus Omnitrophota bacterium]